MIDEKDFKQIFQRNNRKLQEIVLKAQENGHKSIAEDHESKLNKAKNAQSIIEFGVKYPCVEIKNPNVYQVTALAILSDLSSRVGIKDALSYADDDVREEIVNTMSDIIQQGCNLVELHIPDPKMMYKDIPDEAAKKLSQKHVEALENLKPLDMLVYTAAIEMHRRFQDELRPSL